MKGKQILLQTTYATGTASKQISMPASDIEVLNYSIMNGMIDPVFVREQIEMQKRKEILEQHPFSIWQGKNGSWYTYLLNEEGERVLKKRKNQQSLEDLVIEYYRSAVPTVKSCFYRSLEDGLHTRFGKHMVRNCSIMVWMKSWLPGRWGM